MTDREGGPFANTDREIWRERPDDFYADSIHVTEEGHIGINCGGTVIVKPVRAWHALASERAKQAEPVARILSWIGRDTYPKQGYKIARTYEELPEGSYPGSWEEGVKLYAAPLADDEAARLLRKARRKWVEDGSITADEIDAYLAKVGDNARVDRPDAALCGRSGRTTGCASNGKSE